MTPAARPQAFRAAAFALIGAFAVTSCGSEQQSTAAVADTPAAPDAHLSQAEAPVAMASETRAFRDWFAVCDNGNDCTAFGPALADGTGWVRVRMPAGGEARPEVHAGFWPNDGEFGQSPVRVVVDGRPLKSGPLQAGDQDVTLSDPVSAVAALVAGRSMALIQGVEAQRMNLTGATAALLWIDERQGRLDTVTALVRKGDKPASAARPVPDLPVVAAAAAASQANLPTQPTPSALVARPEVASCRAAWNPTSFEEGLTRARLDDRTELWGVACGSGAYNFMTRYFLTGPNGADPRPLELRATNGETREELVNSEYDPATRTLSQFSKGRGIGDCGTASTWTWTGRAFVLSEETMMRECWGAGADRWPTTWRTRSR